MGLFLTVTFLKAKIKKKLVLQILVLDNNSIKNVCIPKF